MLSLLMMLASDPVAAASTNDNDLRARMTAVQQTQAQCRNGTVMRADGRVTTVPRLDGEMTMGQAIARTPRVPLRANDLMFRSGDPVQMTLLLERSVDHCSVPISTELSGPGSALPRFGHGH